MQAETRMDFAPVCPEQMAGFTYCYDLSLIHICSGIGCTEGPRIYHIGSWYYLVVAEGGTGYSHCVTIARSDNVLGPYETMPDNPLLTSDQKDLTAI